MIKKMLKLFIVLLAIFMIAAVDAQLQPNPTSTSGSTSNAIGWADDATSNNKTVEILGIDPTSFPKIKLNIFIK
ncbi:MAG: hypothetical protein LUO89_01640, partial [Methanothrix sp.]|nr:hypothetical protein [Methanothrix sp.]